MNPPAPWEEIERLYHEALELPVGERNTLLARADPALREEVESLLEADSKAGLLESPPTHVVADLLDGQPGGLAPGQRVADYEVESLISIGGMGEVYLARGREGRPVALKILRLHLTVRAQAVDRFETEARAASAL
jgi:serine/threonine protein kinase